MTTPLDMSLDDVIKSSKGNRERARERGGARRGRGQRGPFSGGRTTGAISGGRTTGAVRRGPLKVNTQPVPYNISKSSRRPKSFPWKQDLFEDSIKAAGITGIEFGTKLYVSNLNFGVTNDDIRELFSEIGDLKRYGIHFNKTGRPSGSAEVVYARRSDAFAALKRYNNVLLDGRPMKIEILGADAVMPVSARVNVTGVNGRRRRRRRTVVMTPGAGRGGDRGHATSGLVFRGSGTQSRGGMRNGHARGRDRNGGGRAQGRGGGQGRGKKNPVELSADDLNKELDNYHAEGMQTS